MANFNVLDDEVSVKEDPSLAIKDAVTYAVVASTGVDAASMKSVGKGSGRGSQGRAAAGGGT